MITKGFFRNERAPKDELGFLTFIFLCIFFNYHKSALEIYSDKLVKEGIVSPDDVKSVRDKYEKICDEAFELAKKETHIKVCTRTIHTNEINFAFNEKSREIHVNIFFILNFQYKDWLDSPWSGFFEGKDPLKVAPTGVKEETLVHIGNRFSSPPPNAAEFIIHRGLLRILAARKEMVDNKIVDWALGEAMAFGSLLKEGRVNWQCIK